MASSGSSSFADAAYADWATAAGVDVVGSTSTPSPSITSSPVDAPVAGLSPATAVTGDAPSGDVEEEIVAPALLPTPGFLGGAGPTHDVSVQTEAHVFIANFIHGANDEQLVAALESLSAAEFNRLPPDCHGHSGPTGRGARHAPYVHAAILDLDFARRALRRRL